MKIAIMGYGTVGSGVAEVLKTNHERIVANSMQDELELAKILDLREFPGDEYEQLVTHDFNDILNDPEIRIVVECMGGLRPAYDFVKSLLLAGKHVVTSNKELVAEKGFELLTTAAEKNVNFLFEASVGGGIPVIRPISQCLAANEIEEVAGILNGTTNFILAKMIDDGLSFEEALALASSLGYAEANPAADIEGTDACRKICILASLCFGSHVYPQSVSTEGITKITLADVECAKAIGGVIKLIASAKRTDDGKISVSVAPSVVRNACLLSGVNDVFNAVLVRGNVLGDAVFYGRGAGKLPTASAVVADVIDCAKHDRRRKLLGWGAPVDGFVADANDAKYSYLIRLKASFEDANKAFGSIEKVTYPGQSADETAFISDPMSRKELDALLGQFDSASAVRITDY